MLNNPKTGFWYFLDDVLQAFLLTEDDIAVLKDKKSSYFKEYSGNILISEDGIDCIKRFADTDLEAEKFSEWFTNELANQ